MAALELAHRRISDYHASEGTPPGDVISAGVTVRHLARPVERAGCYAPGGRARYPSTVLMCAAPARVAGVPEVVLCVPPAPDGRIDDATLAAAAVAGVDEVYCVGGAQAIAAMAYGTESIRPVDVIVGPGNRYVAEAKRQVSGAVGVASAFAGPSEVVVVAGPETPADLAAIDLVVQAEHGPDGLAWLVTWSRGEGGRGRRGRGPPGRRLPPSVRPRGHLGLGRFRLPGRRGVRGPRGGQHGRPRAPRAHGGPGRGAPAPGHGGRRRLLRAVGPGQPGRLRGRSQSRPADQPHRPLRLVAAGRRLPAPHPRGVGRAPGHRRAGPGRGRRWPGSRACRPTPSPSGCAA